MLWMGEGVSSFLIAIAQRLSMNRALFGLLAVAAAGVVVAGGWVVLQEQASCMKTDDINYLCDTSTSYSERARFTTAPSTNTCGEDAGDLQEKGWSSCRSIEVTAECRNEGNDGRIMIRSRVALAVDSLDLEVKQDDRLILSLTQRDLAVIDGADDRIIERSSNSTTAVITVRTGRFEEGGTYTITPVTGVEMAASSFIGEARCRID